MLRYFLLSCVVIVTGCKQRVFNDNVSTIQGTQEGEGAIRCGTILPSVDKVLTENIKQIVAHAKNNSGSTARSRVLARETVTMIKNMTLDKTNPIHPVAFFAMVKDFESGTNTNWGQGGQQSAFVGGNCGPVTCYSLFQTDVLGDGNWADGQVCRDMGIWSLRGGPDVCASVYWWNRGGASKCQQISPGGKNPCITSGVAWTIENVRRGMDAYGQLPQQGRDGWADWYRKYEKCYYHSTYYPMLKSKLPAKPAKPYEGVRAAVDAFLIDVGLKSKATLPTQAGNETNTNTGTTTGTEQQTQTTGGQTPNEGDLPPVQSGPDDYFGQEFN